MSADAVVTPGDGPVYFQVAHSLLDGNGLAGNDYRTPGYPIAIVPALLADRVLGHGEAELVLAGQDLLGILAPALPTSKEPCKSGGWQTCGVFKNQGHCVSFVATKGKNSPAGH